MQALHIVIDVRSIDNPLMLLFYSCHAGGKEVSSKVYSPLPLGIVPNLPHLVVWEEAAGYIVFCF